LQLRLRALPGLAGWGARFLWNSRPAAYARNTRRNLRLALTSMRALERLASELSPDFVAARTGTLKLYRDPRAFEEGVTASAALTESGLNWRPLSPAETVALEPGLAPIVDRLRGAIHFPDDGAGDARRFTEVLAARAQALGVVFQFGVAATGIEVRSGEACGVGTREQRLAADRVVVAAGSFTPRLVRGLGLCLPVAPAKGYSITLDEVQDAGLRIPVVDDALHAVVTPLGRGLRVAGTAEFAGFDDTLPEPRIRNLLDLLRAVLPRARFDAQTVRRWSGLRPMSADGVPIIGETSVKNLYVSTGHGHLGWTMAAGSAELLASLIQGEPAEVDPRDYTPARFSIRQAGT
jgi:D-amino-acid dehydrogenase